MRKTLILIVLLVTVVAVRAQIRGVIIDSDSTPIAKAQLAVINLRKNTVVWEGVSDSIGRFILPPVEFTDSLSLNIFHYDYKLYTQLIDTSTKELKVVLDLSMLQASEVTVVGNSRPIRFDKGDIVVDVERIKNSDRLSTAQLMNRIPGLQIENSQIMLKNSPVEIYINGSKPTIPASEILKYIESLPADAVEELRLIPMPSNKYGKAEAVVDIKLKSLRPDDFYSKTTVRGSLLENIFGGGVEEFLMLRKKNITFNTSLTIDKAIKYSKLMSNNYIAQPDITFFSPSVTKMYRNAINSSSNLTVDLKNNSKLDLNLFIYYDKNQTKQDWSYTENTLPSKIYQGDIGGFDDMYSLAIKYSTDQTKKHSLSLYYSGMYGSIGKRGDYFLHDNNNIYNGYLSTDYSMRGYVHNLTFDGELNFFNEKLKLKYGIYGEANFLTDNTYDYEYGTNILKNSSRLETKEFNIRGYVRAEYNISKKQGFALDIGYYQTISNYNFDVSGQNTKKNDAYGYFAPNISYWLKTRNYRMNIGFISKVIRPHYTELLPGKRYVTNYIYTVGNPYLKNAINYDLKINQLFWEFISLDLRSVFTKNDMQDLMNVDSDGLIFATTANTNDRVFYEVALTIPFEIANKKFYGSLSGAFFGDYYFNINPSYNIGFENKSKIAGAARVNLYYDIITRLSLEGSFSWKSRREGYQLIASEQYLVSAGTSYAFLQDKNLIVNFTARNFIKGLQGYYTHSAIVNNDFNNAKPKIPLFQLSISYKFNKGQDIKYRNNQGDFNRMVTQ